MSDARTELDARLATVTGIDAKTIATTSLYTVPTGKTFIPTKVVIRVTAFTVGAKAVQAAFTLGGNGAFDDFKASSNPTISALGQVAIMTAENAAFAQQDAGDVFSIDIATASDATTETWAVDVFGYLI